MGPQRRASETGASGAGTSQQAGTTGRRTRPTLALALSRLGGGAGDDVSHRAAGGVVLALTLAALGVGLAALVAGSSWSPWVSVPCALALTAVVFAVVAATVRLPRGRGGWAVAVVACLAVGIVLGELTSTVLLGSTGSAPASGPAVTAAQSHLAALKDERVHLDAAVDQARAHRDRALVVARCEYSAAPGCPSRSITGVPGAGPQTRGSDQMLADAQGELDRALAARDTRSPSLDRRIAQASDAVAQARTDAGRSPGARWSAMNSATSAHAESLLLRIMATLVFTFLAAVPLLLHRLVGETAPDRSAAAADDRARAEDEAQTSVALKWAEVWTSIEHHRAEQELARARIEADAQTAIVAERERVRVLCAREELRAIEGAPEEAPHSPAASSLPVSDGRTLTHGSADERASSPLYDELSTTYRHDSAAADAEGAEPSRQKERAVTDRNDPDTGKAPSTEVVPASRELVQRAQGPAFIPDWVPSRLPFAGPVTTVTKTVTGLARPFLPTTIVRTVGRTIQTFVEEEEINFTITRKRHVTVEEKTVTEQPVAHGETGRRSALSAGSPSNGQASYHVPSSRVHDAPSAVQGPATRSITGADIVGDLPEWPSLRGLPPAE